MEVLGRIRRFMHSVRATAVPRYTQGGAPADIAHVWNAVSQFTMTSPERVAAVVDAARYVSRNGISGAFVECGVWRGGCSLAAALTFAENEDERDIYLFDTFAGMPAPGPLDVDYRGVTAADQLAADPDRLGVVWAVASEEDVRRTMMRAPSDPRRIHLVKGRVEDTLPSRAPETIAILRLDTDWYESTKHELIALWPRLVSGGVLLIDDYGHWNGCRRAVDEFFESMAWQPLMARTDLTGRLLVKQSPGLSPPELA